MNYSITMGAVFSYSIEQDYCMMNGITIVDPTSSHSRPPAIAKAIIYISLAVFAKHDEATKFPFSIIDPANFTLSKNIDIPEYYTDKLHLELKRTFFNTFL